MARKPAEADEDTDHGSEAETEQGASPRIIGGYARRDGASVVIVMPGAEIVMTTNAPPLSDAQIAHASRLLQTLHEPRG